MLRITRWWSDKYFHILAGNPYINTMNPTRFPPEQVFVFISYGNDVYKDSVRKICEDLKKENFQIWFDEERIMPGSNPHQKIQDALNVLRANPKQSRFLLFITPYSVRMINDQEFGYALNELQIAKNHHIPVFPVILKNAAFPPDIARNKHMDLSDCIPLDQHEQAYHEKLLSLIHALQGEELDSNWKFNDWEYLEKFLTPTPISFENEICQTKHFYGREWITTPIMNWITDDKDSRILLLTGEMGIGKTALSTCILKSLHEPKVYHFINFKIPEKSSPERLIYNLCYQLCKKIEEFKLLILALPLEEIISHKGDRKGTSILSLLDVLVLQPLSRSEIKDKYRIIIIIDALDEIRRSENNYITDDFISALAQVLDKLPESIKLILTSRPEQEIIGLLRTAKRMELLRNSEGNIRDIKEFISKGMKDLIQDPGVFEKVSQGILQKSEGMFLFIAKVINEIRERKLGETEIEEFIENMPKGIHAYYQSTLKRSYPDPGLYDSTLRPYLELSFAAKETINLSDFFSIAKWDKGQKELFLHHLNSLFTEVDSAFKPFHNSLYDWLIDEELAGEFHIDVEKGHLHLAHLGLEILARDSSARIAINQLDNQLLDELPYHLIRLQKFRELEDALADIPYLIRTFNKDKYQCIAYFNQVKNRDQFFDRLGKNALAFEAESTDPYVIANVFQCIGLLYFETKDFEKSIFFLENAVRYCDEITDIFIRAKIHNDLAESYLNHSTRSEEIDDEVFKKAKQQYIKAIICLWKDKNKEFRSHPDLAEYINNYGHLYYYKQAYEKCEALYTRASHIRERCCTFPYDRSLGESKFNLGVTRFYKGKSREDTESMAEGIRMIEEALDIHQKANRYWDKDVALYKITLAIAFLYSGKITEAIHLIEESFSIRLALFGADHVDTVGTFSNWETIISKMQFHPENALFRDDSLIDRALELRKQRLPRHSKEIVTIYLYNATILLYKGKTEDAIRNMKHAERLSAAIQLNPLEILKILLSNVKALLRARHYKYAEDYLSRIYSAYGKNVGITHPQTLEYFQNLMELYFGLPMSERRNAIDFIALLVKIAQEIMDKLNQNPQFRVDKKVIRSMSVAFNEIAFNKHLPEKNWDKSEFYFKRALDFMKICQEEVEIANMEINVQLAYFWSGRPVDIRAIEHAKEILIHHNDRRTFKAALILRSLYEEHKSSRFNTELLLQLFFAVAIVDTKADNLELDMMKRMIPAERVDAFHAEILTLIEAYGKDIGGLLNLLINRAVELTKKHRYTKTDIKEILHEVIFVILADLRVLEAEVRILEAYAGHFGLSEEDVRALLSEFL